jgi:transcription termination factor NusB
MSTAISTSLAPTLRGARTFGRSGEVDRAILRTVLYAALFQAPLTVSQLHRSLSVRGGRGASGSG